MRKIITVLVAVFGTLMGLVYIFFTGKKQGKQEEKNEDLREDNQVLNEEVKRIEKANEIESINSTTDIAHAIDELRDLTADKSH